MAGSSEFTLSEISAIARVLRIDSEAIISIFFGKEVS
jgi:hypothetical protein